MCGRYDYIPGEFREIRIRWNLGDEVPLFNPCYNIAPGKDVPVIVRETEHNQLKLTRWGLVPSWAKDSSIGNRMINARVDAEKWELGYVMARTFWNQGYMTEALKGIVDWALKRKDIYRVWAVATWTIWLRPG